MIDIIKRVFQKMRIALYNQEQYCNFLRKSGMAIGDYCEIYKDVNFGSEPYMISIGNHVRITSGVKFITHDGGVWVLRELFGNPNYDLIQRIIIGDNVHIGIDAIIMPGVKIGNNCIIGCGAIVTKDIPDNFIAVGIPAKCLETVEAYYKKHSKDFLLTKSFSATEKKEYLLKRFKI